MNIMYLCNDAYVYIAAVSIISLLENNKDVDNIHIFIVGEEISRGNKDKLYQTVSSYNRELSILDKPDIKKLVGCEVEMHWWIENVFSRVFLGEVFKDYPDVNKLIYLDCDTLVVGNLSDLWEVNLEDHLAAGVLEAMGNLHKKAIGLQNQDPYFNAGLILIDVFKWRNGNYDKKARDFIRKVNGKMEYADESVLNGIAATDMKIISPKYNLTSLSIYFSPNEVQVYRKPCFHYSKEEIKEAMEDVRVVHFTSSFVDVRPWIEGSLHPYASRWKMIKNSSMWKNQPSAKDNQNIKKRIARRLAMILPIKIRLHVTGFLHAYIKPLKYVRKYNGLYG
ncbi:MAG: glycosyltransferase family 8 protein [Lachnospiraceae bacterium]|nr:glycosyltransferase family 8 protein [Lachnospiraceae bacterium]